MSQKNKPKRAFNEPKSFSSLFFFFFFFVLIIYRLSILFLSNSFFGSLFVSKLETFKSQGENMRLLTNVNIERTKKIDDDCTQTRNVRSKKCERCDRR